LSPIGIDGQRGKVREPHHDERLGVIGPEHQAIVAAQPSIDQPEAGGPAFDLEAAINAKYRRLNVTDEAAAGAARQRDPLGGDACSLQDGDGLAFDPIALLA
jgi:hypothetical protein